MDNPKKSKAKIVKLNPGVEKNILDLVFSDLEDLDKNLDDFFGKKDIKK